jgi:short-subunit dehydrogenase
MRTAFSDKTVLVTGAASGIGRALAQRLASMGARLVLVDRDGDGLALAAAGARAAGAPAHALVCDVSELAAFEAAWRTLPPAFAAVDVAIANAGISQITRPTAFDAEQSQRIMRVNYFGTVNVVALTLPGMIARGHGHLVAVSSLAGYRGLPGSACYGASKAAQAIFLEGLRVDLRGTGVRASVVLPGFVDTPINAPLHELYHLPFMITPDAAARRILRGLARGRTRIVFPLPSRVLGIISLILPNRIYDFCLRLNPFIKRGQPAAPLPQSPSEPSELSEPAASPPADARTAWRRHG